MGSKLFYVASAGLLLASPALGASLSPLHIHDENGQLGTVDVATGDVVDIGDLGVQLTDIAFAPDGDLFGISVSTLFRVDPETAATTEVGTHGIAGANALVFDSDGRLFAAGVGGTELFEIDTATAESQVIGDTGFESAGDLAFNGGSLFLSSTQDTLVEIDVVSGEGLEVGAFGFSGVLGLATGGDGTLFGLSGTNVFSVDTATGQGTQVVNFAGQGFSQSFGSSFIDEAVTVDLVIPTPPAPSTPSGVVPSPAALPAGLMLLAAVAGRRKREA